MVSGDPMENGAESHEGGEGGGQLLVPGSDAPVTFERGEEILHMMPVPVVATMEVASFLAGGVEREAGKDVLLHQQGAQRVGVVAFVGYERAALLGRQILHQRWGHGDIGHVASAEQEFERTPLAIDQSMDFRREATTAQAHGLVGAVTFRIESAVMDPDVARIDEAKPARGFARQALENAIPQPRVTPSGKVTVRCAPVKSGGRQIAPGTARSQDIQERFHQLLQPGTGPASTSPLIPVFTRLWLLYAEQASAPTRDVSDRSSATCLADVFTPVSDFSNTP